MTDFVLCSQCFTNQGLKLDAFQIGVEAADPCPNCNAFSGRKLTKELAGKLAQRFFVRGTIAHMDYGAAPIIQMNDYHYQKSTITFAPWLKEDVALLEETIKMGFFHYGPRLWMVGEVEPLKSLEDPAQRAGIIARILSEYPARTLAKGEIFFRVRKNPQRSGEHSQYDSPPVPGAYGRLDSVSLSVMYGSQDLELCIHECRVTVTDELFVASLKAERDLKLLDLTELIAEDATEFESLDIAVHMLFLAGEHSYAISRDIALAAKNRGFDGIIYPSFFSLIRTGAPPFDTIYGISIRRIPQLAEHAKAQSIPNFALFGWPIADGVVSVECINRVVLNRVAYDIHFGPVDY